jgi:D-xylose transport system substrate-binding protein
LQLKRLMMAGAATAAVLGLAACGSSSNSASTATKVAGPANGGGKPVTVGVDLYSQVEHRWTYDQQYFERYAKQMGVKVIIRFADNNSTTQSNDVAALLAHQVNALVVAPVDVNNAGALISQAQRAHVPFIDYDISVPNSKPSYVVVRNQDQACADQVNAALKAAPKGNYALIEGDAGNDLAQACHAVYDKMLLHHPGIHVVYENWTPSFDTSTALTDAENILTKNNDNIQAFVSTNDSMALGVIQALRERHLAGKVFVSGLNADPANLEAIAAGTQNMTIWTPIDTEVKAALNAAVALARGKTPPSTGTFHNSVGTAPAYFIPNDIVDKQNLCNYLTTEAPPFAGAPTPQTIFPNDPGKCTK